LLGGPAAFKEVKGDDVFWTRRLPKEFGSENYWEDWEGSTNKLNYKDVANKLRLLLVNEEEMSLSDRSIGYDFLYKTFSLFGTHANLSTIGLYLTLSDKGCSVVQKPEWPTPSVHQSAAIYTAHLTKFVFKAFGLETDRIEFIGQSLLRMAKEGAVREAAGN
jgi:hypothetical protein